MMNIEFNAIVYVSKVMEAIRSAEHVTDVWIDEEATPRQGCLFSLPQQRRYFNADGTNRPDAAYRLGIPAPVLREGRRRADTQFPTSPKNSASMDNNRYRLPTDRLINCLTPHYLSGRRYILLLQSLVWPLQSLNDRFCAWARERQIEARMTSQVMWFEWWLNYRFRRYFRDASDAIYITDSTPLGVDLYHEGATVGRPFTVWYEGEQVTTDSDDENPRRSICSSKRKPLRKSASWCACRPSPSPRRSLFTCFPMR